MKTIYVLLYLIVSIVSVKAQNTSANADDILAIKKAISDESDGYFNRNYEQWSNAWSHEPHLQWTGNGSNGVVLLANGWADYSAQLGGNFKGDRATQPAKVQRDNYQVNIVGDAATATFTQTLSVGSYHGKSREVRVLEKKGGTWKLVYVNSRNI